MLLIVTTVSTGLCAHLWVEYNRLEANDIKFRAIRQVYPAPAKWADEYYSKNPKAMEAATEQLENEALEKSVTIDSIHEKENSNHKFKKRH
jgi:hypothetical protein